jgi:hypothetical protein
MSMHIGFEGLGGALQVHQAGLGGDGIRPCRFHRFLGGVSRAPQLQRLRVAHPLRQQRPRVLFDLQLLELQGGSSECTPGCR